MSLRSVAVSLASILVSASIALAAPAPSFEVKDIQGKIHRLSDYKGKNVVLEWFNPGCPFVKRVYDSKQMQDLQREYTTKGFVWLTVNSTESGHGDYLNESKSAELAEAWKLGSTAFVLDPDGTLGHSYGAKSTPTVYVIGKDGELVYQGAVDNYPDVTDEPEKLEPYLKNVLSEIAAGKAPSRSETKAYGCSIKYKS